MSSGPDRGTRKAGIACAGAALFILAALGSARAQAPATAGWARATLPGQDSGVAYLTITSPIEDRLTAASSPDASAAMLHQTTHAAGVSGMTDLDGLTLPAGKPVALTPGGTHIMLTGLRRKLAVGERLRLDLTFAHAGVVRVNVPVAPAGATAPPG